MVIIKHQIFILKEHKRNQAIKQLHSLMWPNKNILELFNLQNSKDIVIHLKCWQLTKEGYKKNILIDSVD